MEKDRVTQENASIVARIQERYGRYAGQALAAPEPLAPDADGQAPQTGRAATTLAGQLYDQAALLRLASSVTNVSLGCGNPLAKAGAGPGEVVLDLGSGGGLDCFLASQQVGGAGFVAGIDATPAMTALAQINKARMACHNVAFCQGVIESLPFRRETFDLLISNCVIDISPDKSSVFAEAFRVLKPGGRLAISDTVVLGALPAQLKANVDRWAGAVITPLITLPEYLGFMAQAGFQSLYIEGLTSYGLENFAALDAASRRLLTRDYTWQPLPAGTGLYSALIAARKPVGWP